MFVAVWPDGPTADRLSELELGPTEEVRLVRPDQWHITLRFLGDVDEDLVPTLADTLRSAAAELPDSIKCRVGPGTAWFGGDRVLHIPVSGLDRAADAIRRATQGVVPGTSRGDPEFTGHLTVARSKRRRLTASARTALGGVSFDASFEVNSIDLVDSHLSSEGARYTTLERVSL
jgi:2'-5' RNA ligase